MDKKQLEGLKDKLIMAKTLQQSARREITLTEAQAKALAEAIKKILRKLH